MQGLPVSRQCRSQSANALVQVEDTGGRLSRDPEPRRMRMTNREEVLSEVFELALYNDMTYFG